MSVHVATFDPPTGTNHATKLFCVMRTSIGTNESSCTLYLVGLETDGGGNNYHKHVQNQIALFSLFILGNMDKLKVTRVCPGVSFLNTSERAMALLNIDLSGLVFKSNVRVVNELFMDEVIGKS